MNESQIYNYRNLENSYKEEDYFDVVNITIPLQVIDPEKADVSYKVNDLYVEYDNKKDNCSSKKQIIEVVNKVNQSINLYRKERNEEWNIFYLYKELIQQLRHENNYYRGQLHNWPMLPGILRNTTNNELKNNFESLYKDIMYRYPNKINYYEPSGTLECIQLREQQLAYLQHYGMNTSLLDITENPYIALIFMITDSKNSFQCPTFEIYYIDRELHTKNNLYSRVKMLNSNQRIIAQKGAFLNFDKLALFTQDNTHIEKILTIRITLKPEYPELEKLKKIYKEIEEKLKSSKVKSVDLMMEFLDTEFAIQDKERYLTKGFLKMVKTTIKNKLQEYHYNESDLFPDLFKYITYRQQEYISKKEKEYKIQVDNFTINNIEKLL